MSLFGGGFKPSLASQPVNDGIHTLKYILTYRKDWTGFKRAGCRLTTL